VVIEFEATLWEYQGEAPWVFVTLPNEDADEIEDRVAKKGGFGSVRVTAEIGGSKWQTSLFPDKASASYVLPVKRAIRDHEDLAPGDTARVTLTIELG